MNIPSRTLELWNLTLLLNYYAKGQPQPAPFPILKADHQSREDTQRQEMPHRTFAVASRYKQFITIKMQVRNRLFRIVTDMLNGAFTRGMGSWSLRETESQCRRGTVDRRIMEILCQWSVLRTPKAYTHSLNCVCMQNCRLKLVGTVTPCGHYHLPYLDDLR